MTRNLCISLLFILIFSGCTVAPTSPLPERPSPNQINVLLGEAQAALDADRLTTPADNNALDRYQQVLAIDPDNSAAIDGVNRITETYLAWSRDYAEAGNIQPARRFLALAERVDPNHPNLAPVANLINDREESRSLIYELNAVHVANRNADAIAFQAIAAAIERQAAFITIRAPDDASGRWLYQRLNERVSFRVEATFQFARSPTITLIL